jgi:hypothetical protein
MPKLGDELCKLAHTAPAFAAVDATCTTVSFCDISSAPRANTTPTAINAKLPNPDVRPLKGFKLVSSPSIHDCGFCVPVAGVALDVGCVVLVGATLPTLPISEAGTLMPLHLLVRVLLAAVQV